MRLVDDRYGEFQRRRCWATGGQRQPDWLNRASATSDRIAEHLAALAPQLPD